jgi:hypothetical protein
VCANATFAGWLPASCSLYPLKRQSVGVFVQLRDTVASVRSSLRENPKSQIPKTKSQCSFENILLGALNWLGLGIWDLGFPTD